MNSHLVHYTMHNSLFCSVIVNWANHSPCSNKTQCKPDRIGSLGNQQRDFPGNRKFQLCAFVVWLCGFKKPLCSESIPVRHS